MVVDSGTWLLKRAKFETDQVEVVLRCFDYEVNAGMDAGDFKFDLPDDVTVYEGLPRFMGRSRLR